MKKIFMYQASVILSRLRLCHSLVRHHAKHLFIVTFSHFLIFSFPNSAYAQAKPTPQQLAWHDMEFYLFMHFGPNTFTNVEWGKGNEKEAVFNPTQLDCGQWCRVAKASGAKGIIITAKHHDGFCLWPSKYSKHTVKQSRWKKGKGDVLKELSRACKKFGLKFGVYISPWDRNHPDYGTEKYNDVFVNMMKELFTNYGPIWELWWDGANGEGPNGKKQVYDWKRFEATVRQLSPNTVIFSDIGPDIRWCGNENGIAGETNWNYLDTAGFTRGAGSPPQDTLNTGNVYGANWIPAECDVSIRPGWFWHKAEDGKVKSREALFELYLKSVGRGANLLLNVPPNRQGLISKPDENALKGFRYYLNSKISAMGKNEGVKGYFMQLDKKLPCDAILDGNPETFEKINLPFSKLILEFSNPGLVNCVILQESLKDGQQCKKFKLELKDKDGKLLQTVEGTTIGHKRIVTFASAGDVSSIELTIPERKSGPVLISTMEAKYLMPIP